MEAFTRRFAGAVEVSTGVAASDEQAVLISNRLADIAIGPGVTGEQPAPITSEPIFKYRLGVVAARQFRPRGPARLWRWLVDPSGTDTGSDTANLLRRIGVPEANIRVFPSQTAAWAAAADGAGVAPAIEHLVSHQLRRGELVAVNLPGLPAEEIWYATMLERERRSTAAGSLRRFLGTPEAMQLMRSPAAGVSPSRFKPPVYVTIWS
jgi:DNA-binding transcriptional LysR family regulator